MNLRFDYEGQWFRAYIKIDKGEKCLGCRKAIQDDDEISDLFWSKRCGWKVYHIDCLPRVLRNVCKGCVYNTKTEKGEISCKKLKYIKNAT